MTNERVEALEKRVQALENKQDVFKHHVLGWREGFSEGVKSQLQHIEKRIAKMRELDDSNVFEINKWIEEIMAIKNSVLLMQKRLKAVEEIINGVM